MYIRTVPEQSGAGIGLPNQSAQALNRSAFSLPEIQFLAGCMEALRSAATLSGKTNSVQPATILIGLSGGSSLSQSEEAVTMTAISTRRTRATTKSAHLAQVQINLEIIQAALCSQALLCRFDSEASTRLLNIAGEVESISSRIGGGHYA